MNKILAIIGAGHLGQQIAHFAIEDNHYSKVVFFDDFSNENSINNYEILGKTIDVISEFNKKSFDEIIIGIGYNHLSKRKEFYDLFSSIIPFGKIIHSSCIIDKTSKIEDGCVLYPGSCIDARVSILSNCIINLSCTIAHDSTIENHSFLAPRVAIAGFVSIGEQCNLGINSTIIDSVSICSKTQIGGATVVIKNITESGRYVGNPSRKIK
jgi:sugar O-acyltransferase (sialic acid O-acetyltransferase NeuD family)